MSEATAAVREPEGGVEEDNLDTPAIVMWTFVSVVAVVSVMLAAAALFYQTEQRLAADRLIAPKYTNSEQTVTDQRGLLLSYGKPAGEGKPYRIPIDRAKQLVLQDLQATN
ncbi:MAG: hypothetical protein AAFV43_04465 [Planctomycetota bacterium]